MKLKELLETIPSNKHVGIGSQSGYVMFTEPNALELISLVFKNMYDIYEDRLCVYESKYRYASSVKYDGVPKGPYYKKWLAERKATISGYKDTIKKCKNYLSTFIEPLDREVIDYFETLDGDIAIIISGFEVGKYWYREEYEKDIKKVC